MALFILACFAGCDVGQTPTPTPPPVANDIVVEQDETYYIVSTDWMTFYFSKGDYRDSDVKPIASEAVSVMEDVRAYLNVNYTASDAAGSECYFDSTYRYMGEERSSCHWTQKRLDCIGLIDFVHEYVHLVSERNADLVYHPPSLFTEGLAEYVSLTFHDGIASQEYQHFNERPVSENSSPAEHEWIRALLSEKQLPYNAKNYKLAFVALLDRNYDIAALNKDGDFYKYDVGLVFVRHCIEQRGGMEAFLSVYCDSLTVSERYGKALDDLVLDACAENTNYFYGEESSQ